MGTSGGFVLDNRNLPAPSLTGQGTHLFSSPRSSGYALLQFCNGISSAEYPIYLFSKRLVRIPTIPFETHGKKGQERDHH